MKEYAADSKDCREGSLECSSNSEATLSCLEKAAGGSSHKDALLYPWDIPVSSCIPGVPMAPAPLMESSAQAWQGQPQARHTGPAPAVTAVTRDREGLCPLRSAQGRNVGAL